MPPMIKFMVTRLLIGFSIGGLTAVALILGAPTSVGNPKTCLAGVLIIYGLGSVFALGYLATALSWDS
jgi:hypothetical protein